MVPVTVIMIGAMPRLRSVRLLTQHTTAIVSLPIAEASVLPSFRAWAGHPQESPPDTLRLCPAAIFISFVLPISAREVKLAGRKGKLTGGKGSEEDNLVLDITRLISSSRSTLLYPMLPQRLPKSLLPSGPAKTCAVPGVDCCDSGRSCEYHMAVMLHRERYQGEGKTHSRIVDENQLNAHRAPCLIPIARVYPDSPVPIYTRCRLSLTTA